MSETSEKVTLPVLTPDGGLSRYLQEIRQFPVLDPEEEYMLAKRWREHEDSEAAHKMVTSHLRPVSYTHLTLPTKRIV